MKTQKILAGAMMPLAPTPIVPVSSKPKIGFSIDSIVGGGGGGGGGRDARDETAKLDRMDLDRDDSSPPDVAESRSSRLNPVISSGVCRSPGAHSEESDRPGSRDSSVESYPSRTRHRPAHHHTQSHSYHHRQLNSSQITSHHRPHEFTSSGGGNRSLTGRSHSGGSSPDRPSPSPPSTNAQNQAIGAPPGGIVRPSPNYLGVSPGNPSVSAAVAAEHLKNFYRLNQHGHPGQPGGQGGTGDDYHSQQLAFAAAAQHLQAANLAAALQAHHGGPPHGPYGGHPGGPQGPHLSPHLHQPPRDSIQLYPWLLSRHGRIFPQRFPGGLLTFFHTFR